MKQRISIVLQESQILPFMEKSIFNFLLKIDFFHTLYYDFGSPPPAPPKASSLPYSTHFPSPSQYNTKQASKTN